MSVSGNTFSGGVDLSLRRPDNTSFGGFAVFGPTGASATLTLSVTGTYVVVIDPRAQQVGSLTFVVADAPALLAAAPVAEVQQDERSVDESSSVDPPAIEVADTARAVAAAAIEPLTITVAQLLANDRPGPDNESAQSLTVTEVVAGPSTHGTVTFADGVVTYLPDEDFVGNATIPYTVCDNGTTNGLPDPRCSTGGISVKVTQNHPPVIVPQSLATVEDTPVGLTLSGSDPDGQAITYVITAQPSRGVLSGTAPALTYTPAPDANGTDSFAFAAHDGNDQSLPATVTIAIAAVNDPPVPQPDTMTAAAGQPVTVPATTLIANDDAGPFDESAQTLTVTAVTDTPDTHGMVVLAGGNVTYTPDAGFTGTAVVGYTVCDDGTTGGAADPRCATSTWSITANRPPVAHDQSAQTSLTKPVAIVLGATDPDGDALTFAVASSPAHGTLSGTAPNVTYTAAAGFIGDDSFTFTASDAFGTSNTATVTVTVADVPSPTLGPDTASVRSGRSIDIDVLANDLAGSGTIATSTLTVSAPATKGTAVALVNGRVRYTANAGATGPDTFSYTVCDTGGGCGSAIVTVTISENTTPVATDDSYDMAAGGSLRPAAPGILDNDVDPDSGEVLQAHLVSGVGNGRLLLNGNGSFTYVPNGPGIDAFTYRVVDAAGATSNVATVTIYVTGPSGPPIVGNDLFEVQRGRELSIAAPGVLTNDTSPNPRLGLTVQLQRDAAKGTLRLQPDGSFVYTPLPGYTGIDQFSYTVRDSEGRVSAEAHVGITVTAGGPPTATVGATSPADGSTVLGPTSFTATLVPPAGESVTEWSVSYHHPGDPVLVPLASGSGNAVTAEFDPTLVENGTYAIVVRAVTSNGGVLVTETGVVVEGDYKPGRYTTTYRDVALNSTNIPIELLRTYDSIDKSSGDLGVGWTLELANFRVESNGALGGGGWHSYTCGSFPFLATCYVSDKPHIVSVTWPDGHVERFRFTPNQGSQLVPTITTAGFTAEPGTTSTLTPVGSGLLLSGTDFLLGDFFSADGIYDPIQFVLTDREGTQYRIDRRAGLLGITDRNGNTVSIGDDGVGSSSGLSLGFVRDSNHRITRIDAPGGDIVYTYSTAGDLERVDYPDGTSQQFTYDAEHQLQTVTGGGQLVRTLHYDGDGRVTAITDGNNVTTSVDIDVDGHQSVITDPTGRLTTINTYDDRGDLIRQDRVADGRTITTSATFDAVGHQLSTTDGENHTTSTTYDGAGNVLTSTDENHQTTTYTYNSFGQVLTITDPLHRVTTNVYDARGNLLTTTAPDHGVTTYTYDGSGNVLTERDPTGRITTNTYVGGYLATTTDHGNHTTSQTVDPATGRVSAVTDPAGATTMFEYDHIGRVTAVTDGEEHGQQATYDEFDRITSLTDSNHLTSTVAYDGAGNVDSTKDRNGQTIDYGYDAAGHLLTKSVPGAGTTTYTYDGFGRRITATNATAQLAYTYDDANRILTLTSAPTTAGALPTTTFTYVRDPAGNITSVQGPGGTSAYGYDDGSQLTSLTDPAGGLFEMAYDGAGRRTSLTRPNGVDDTIVFDLAGNVTSIHTSLGASLLARSDYTYDPAGRRDTLTSLVGTATFGYDGASQVTSASFPAAAGLPAEQYDYDLAGNRTTSETPPPGPFTYDDADRLLEDAAATYQYDGEGNLISRTVKATNATTTYTWTAEHQLVGIGYPDGTSTTFRYDPDGRRVAIDDGLSSTRFAFDGTAIAAEYDLANSLIATYVHEPKAPTYPFEMVRGGQRSFYVQDALGSTVALTDAAGAVVVRYAYGAFGTATQTGAAANLFTFTGQLRHEKSGLLLFPLRAYDPALGRFLSEDPLPSTNAYPYVANNPVNAVDPTGAAIEERAEIEDTYISPYKDTLIRGGGDKIDYFCLNRAFDLIATLLFPAVGGYGPIGAAEFEVIDPLVRLVCK